MSRRADGAHRRGHIWPGWSSALGRALLTSDRPGGGDARWLVPLFVTTACWEQYTMLSWLHLRDRLNQQLLVAPVVLPALAALGALARPSTESRD
ncbi:MAG: hypothetical protein R3A10_01065 [Caldilineaceae bacterium]